MNGFEGACEYEKTVSYVDNVGNAVSISQLTDNVGNAVGISQLIDNVGNAVIISQLTDNVGRQRCQHLTVD